MANVSLQTVNRRAALDTNILLDLVADNPNASEAALNLLVSASADGPVVICPVVYAELGVAFPQQATLEQFLSDLGVRLEAFSAQSLQVAAAAWSAYLRRRGRQIECARCGHRFALHCIACQSQISWRQHLITDFLVGAHAATQATKLITRDPGYFRTYFPQLRLVVP